MSIFRAVCAGALSLALSGCLHTEVVNEVMSKVPEAPYRRILVCSFTNESGNAILLEEHLAGRLRKHKVFVQSCDEVLISSASAQGFLPYVREHFDAVLVTRREPRPMPDPKEDHGFKSVLFAPRTSVRPPAAERREDHPKPQTLAQFGDIFFADRQKKPSSQTRAESASEETILEPFGEKRFIYGAADLISIREDQLVWSLGGYIEGGKHESIPRIIKVLVRSVEKGLISNNLIP
jgi:hypothetical protein